MKRVVVLVSLVVAACRGGSDDVAQLGVAQQAVFDCNDPGQRFSCPAPDDPDKVFVCHATGSTTNPYAKISVPAHSAHAPGVAHHAGGPADQAPGASGNDVGAGAGLDCECQPRVCQGTCTGAETGAECDDGDRCTGNGTCSGDTCVAGAPSCVAGTPVDSCNVESGACDGETGECFVEPLPAGTTCSATDVCNGDGACVECLDASMCAPGFACEAGACVGVPHVTINEVESSGGVPGDWIELVNTGTAAADVSGWRLLDNDNAHTPYVIPAGTVIPVGGFFVADEAQFGFGLGAADSARLFDANGVLVDTYSWTTHAVTTYGRCPDGTGAFRTTTASTKGGPNDCHIAVRINEVESSGGVPGDWVELFNPGPIPVDLSGFIFRDNDDAHGYVIPQGTTLGAGGYYLLEEAAFGFGLGAADAARLYDAQATPIDSYTWTTHAATTYGRCPNGTGPFVTTASATKGATNACSGGGGGTAAAWPGRNQVTTADNANTFGTNLSGLYAEGNALWAVRNAPSTLFHLVPSGSVYVPDRTIALRYPSGTGDPDSEDVTKSDDPTAVYVVAERDNTVSAVSRLSILRYDTAQPGSELSATHEWNLTADLPAVGANLGLEALTWVPDSYLVAHGFFDGAANAPYNPAAYPGHGNGLFFVGLEANGIVYAYALDHVGGGFTRIASFSTGDPTVKAISFDREVGYLWSACGATCGNQTSVFTVDTTGKFALKRQFGAPSSMANFQNEGITMAPEAACSAGQKPFFWADDSQSGGHALRVDSIPCGPFIP